MKIKFLSLLFLIFIGNVALAQKAETPAQATVSAQDYKSLEGNYTSAENPDGILVYVEGGKLMAKMPQQASFALVHSVQNTYETSVGLLLHFEPQHKQLIVQKDRKRQVLVKQNKP